MGKENAFEVADSAAQHGSNKKCGGEHAAGSAADEGDGSRDNFEDGKNREDFPGVLAVHGLVHGIVACAHDLGIAEKGDESDEKAGGSRLKVLGPSRKRSEARTEIADGFGEENGSEA